MIIIIMQTLSLSLLFPLYQILKEHIILCCLFFFSQSQGYSASIIHPCYPVDHSATIKMNSVFDSPCSEKYKAQNSNSQSSLTIRGGAHYEHCVGNVSEIFSFDGCVFSRCSFDNVFQPNVTGSFVVRPTGRTCTHTHDKAVSAEKLDQNIDVHFKPR